MTQPQHTIKDMIDCILSGQMTERQYVRYIDVLLPWLCDSHSKTSRIITDELNARGIDKARAKKLVIQCVDSILFDEIISSEMVLGAVHGLSISIARTRYKQLMHLFHPDRGSENEINTRRTEVINTVYSHFKLQNKVTNKPDEKKSKVSNNIRRQSELRNTHRKPENHFLVSAKQSIWRSFRNMLGKSSSWQNKIIAASSIVAILFLFFLYLANTEPTDKTIYQSEVTNLNSIEKFQQHLKETRVEEVNAFGNESTREIDLSFSSDVDMNQKPVIANTTVMGDPDICDDNNSGRFQVYGSIICAPSRKAFVPIGFNAWSQHSLYPAWGANLVENRDTYIKEWNINMLRLNVACITPSPTSVYRSKCSTAEFNEPLDEIIDVYAGNSVPENEKVVILIDYHVANYPYAPTLDLIKESTDFMSKMALQYEDNPYVWLQPWNEPLNECNEAHVNGWNNDSDKFDISPSYPNVEWPDQRGLASALWKELSLNAMNVIRQTGNMNPIVLNTSNYGQDRCDSNQEFDEAESAILTFGQDVLSMDPIKNLVFDLHFYSRWAESDLNTIENYFTQISNQHLAILIGEIGGKYGSLPLHAQDLKAAGLFFELKNSRRCSQTESMPCVLDYIGALAWNAGMGFPLTNDAGEVNNLRDAWDLTYDSNGKPNNLTELGVIFWAYAHDSFVELPLPPVKQPIFPPKSIMHLIIWDRNDQSDSWIWTADGYKQWVSLECRSKLANRLDFGRVVKLSGESDWHSIVKPIPAISKPIKCELD